MIMTFGKFQGYEIEDIPSSYLFWFAENIDPKNKHVEELIKACDSEYWYRDKYDCHFEE